MNQILSITKVATIIIIGMFIVPSNVYAKTPDGETPAEETVCDGLTGPAYGLCNAYCEAMDCDSEDKNASDKACERVLDRFLKITGYGIIPCEDEVSPVVGSWQPMNNTDDGIWWDYGIEYSNSSLYLGKDHVVPIHSFIRFPNVTIPAGATIDTAVLRFTSDGIYSGTSVNVNIYFNNADNPAAPDDYDDCNDLILTNAIAWNDIGSWSSEVEYDSPELKTILQTVINRTGWASGQAILAVVKDNSSSDGVNRQCYDSYFAQPNQSVELVVTYTLP